MPQSKKARLSDDVVASDCATECSNQGAVVPLADGDAVREDDSGDAVRMLGAVVEEQGNDDANDAEDPSRKRIVATSGVAAATAQHAGLRETDVGITEYASQLEPIDGVLKQRYADFVVNEIALSGEVVHLTSTDDIEQSGTGTAPPKEDPSTTDLFSPEDLQLLKELNQSNDVNMQVKIAASTDKAVRTQQHGYIRLHFPMLRSSYEQDGEQRKYLVITKVGGNNKSRNAENERWPKDRPKYLHFVLYKEFKDTMEAIDVIAKYAGLRPHAFTYVGTKDKRARTTQQVALYRVEASRLRRVNEKLLNMAVGNFSYRDQPLQLGELLGNRFGIVLRQVTASESAISKAMECLQSRGFINYFGMQRFGTSAVPTHDVGKRLLRGDFAGAVDLILGDRPGERPSVAAARRVWSTTGDPRATLAALPRSCAVERRLADGLIEHKCVGRCSGSNLQGQDKASNGGTQPCQEQRQSLPELSRGDQERWRRSLESLPRGTRQIYVHSYQSYVWNRVASRRIREFGLEPRLGDLVVLRSGTSGCDSRLPEQSSEPRQDGCDGDSAEDKVSKWNVKLLQNAEELVTYSIYDVCLPLPGYDIMYPDNDVKSWYEKVLQEDKMTFDCFRSKSKDYSLPGSYRMLMAKPGDLSWRTCHYDDPNVPLIQSDLDRLTGASLGGSGDQYTALVMEFSLPTSTYATMALREVLRTDTSSGHQSTLNSVKELPPASASC